MAPLPAHPSRVSAMHANTSGAPAPAGDTLAVLEGKALELARHHTAGSMEEDILLILDKLTARPKHDRRIYVLEGFRYWFFTLLLKLAEESFNIRCLCAVPASPHQPRKQVVTIAMNGDSSDEETLETSNGESDLERAYAFKTDFPAEGVAPALPPCCPSSAWNAPPRRLSPPGGTPSAKGHAEGCDRLLGAVLPGPVLMCEEVSEKGQRTTIRHAAEAKRSGDGEKTRGLFSELYSYRGLSWFTIFQALDVLYRIANMLQVPLSAREACTPVVPRCLATTRVGAVSMRGYLADAVTPPRHGCLHCWALPPSTTLPSESRKKERRRNSRWCAPLENRQSDTSNTYRRTSWESQLDKHRRLALQMNGANFGRDRDARGCSDHDVLLTAYHVQSESIVPAPLHGAEARGVSPPVLDVPVDVCTDVASPPRDHCTDIVLLSSIEHSIDTAESPQPDRALCDTEVASEGEELEEAPLSDEQRNDVLAVPRGNINRFPMSGTDVWFDNRHWDMYVDETYACECYYSDDGEFRWQLEEENAEDQTIDDDLDTQATPVLALTASSAVDEAHSVAADQRQVLPETGSDGAHVFRDQPALPKEDPIWVEDTAALTEPVDEDAATRDDWLPRCAESLGANCCEKPVNKSEEYENEIEKERNLWYRCEFEEIMRSSTSSLLWDGLEADNKGHEDNIEVFMECIRVWESEHDAELSLGHFVRTNNYTTERLIKFAGVDSRSVCLDIGCGDGEVLRYVVNKTHCRGIGLEVNPKLCRAAKQMCKYKKVDDRITFIQSAVEEQPFIESFRDVTLVFLFVLDARKNISLINMLQKFLEQGTTIITNRFELPAPEFQKLEQWPNEDTLDGMLELMSPGCPQMFKYAMPEAEAEVEVGGAASVAEPPRPASCTLVSSHDSQVTCAGSTDATCQAEDDWQIAAGAKISAPTPAVEGSGCGGGRRADVSATISKAFGEAEHFLALKGRIFTCAHRLCLSDMIGTVTAAAQTGKIPTTFPAHLTVAFLIAKLTQSWDVDYLKEKYPEAINLASRIFEKHFNPWEYGASKKMDEEHTGTDETGDTADVTRSTTTGESIEEEDDDDEKDDEPEFGNPTRPFVVPPAGEHQGACSSDDEHPASGADNRHRYSNAAEGGTEGGYEYDPDEEFVALEMVDGDSSCSDDPEQGGSEPDEEHTASGTDSEHAPRGGNLRQDSDDSDNEFQAVEVCCRGSGEDAASEADRESDICSVDEHHQQWDLFRSAWGNIHEADLLDGDDNPDSAFADEVEDESDAMSVLGLHQWSEPWLLTELARW